jgi:uncharacterized glyoxalase superfamily protein PhnB
MKNKAETTGSTFFAPHLTVRNVLAELNFCKAAFGAVELRRFGNPDGSVHVAEMSIGGALFHIHEQMPRKCQSSLFKLIDGGARSGTLGACLANCGASLPERSTT